MSRRNVIQQTFDDFCKSQGWEKKNGTWYSRQREVVGLVDLQRSDWGPQYYVNVAFWLPGVELRAIEIPATENPKTWRSHVMFRWTSIVGVDVRQSADLLDLEFEISDDERRSRVTELLSSSVGRVIAQGRSVDELRQLLSGGAIEHYAALPEARDALGIVGPT